MTLSTDIYLRVTEAGPSQDEVFDKLNEILGTPPRDQREVVDGPIDTSIWPDRVNQRRLSNQIGQGFPAIIYTRAMENHGPMVGEHDTDSEWPCEPDCDYSAHVVPKHHIHADLDTAYGYKDERGWGCTELHAMCIVRLHAWLTEEFPGAVMWWVDEYRDALHEGCEPDDLSEFLGGGDRAAAWFNGSVKPLLDAMGATR